MNGFDEEWLRARLAAGNVKVAGSAKPAPRAAKATAPKGKPSPLTEALNTLAALPSTAPKKPRRYRNEPVENEHGKFDSKHEYATYVKLMVLEKEGLISDLKRQVPFILAPAVKLGGRVKPALKIIVDFTFTREGVLVAADAKSAITKKKDAYRIKKHLVKTVHNLEVEEM